MSFFVQARRLPKRLRPWLEVAAALVWTFLLVQLFTEDLQTSGSEPATPAGTTSSPSASHVDIQAATPTIPNPGLPAPSAAVSPDATNPVVPLPAGNGVTPVKRAAPSLPSGLLNFFAATNGLPRKSMSAAELQDHWNQKLELARYLRATRQPEQAEPMLVELLEDKTPELLRQSVLLELAAVAQDENNLSRAQQIYSQFLEKWPDDLRVPEILLRQGVLFRQMGMFNLAFTKFYGVMTSALVLKNDQLDYYIRLVQQAQVEIAESQYQLGKYADAADLFNRLLKQNNPANNRPEIIYKLARCHIALDQYAEAASEAQDFLERYADAPEQPEMRFYLALALKKIGRNNESLQQVLMLLQEQRARTKGRPEQWAYWQQRAGNLIANQLYQEGDYTKALGIYLNLAQIDASLQWQLPVLYQVGMTYERLWQPQKATETYTGILSHEKELGTNAPPDLKTVFDMARWRIGFIQWQESAEAVNRRLHVDSPTNSSTAIPITGTVSASP